MPNISLTKVGRAGTEPEPYEVDRALVQHVVPAGAGDMEHYPGSRTVIWVGPGPGLVDAEAIHVEEAEHRVRSLLVVVED